MRMFLAASLACVMATPAATLERSETAQIVLVAQKLVPGASTHLPKVTTKPVPATIGLKCGDKIYTLSVVGGVCKGTKKSKTCTDGNGNSASASCAKGCKKTKGTGSCFEAEAQ